MNDYMLRRRKTPLTLISHTQQDANTQDFFVVFLTLSLAIRITQIL
jgi:hypothetical protein